MKATVLKTSEIKNTRYPLAKSLRDAAGMLRGKLPDGVKYQKKMRKEWEKVRTKR